MIKEWIHLGQYPGQKTEDLVQLSQLKPKGLTVIPGISLGASYFLDCIARHDYFGRIKFPFNGMLSPSLRLANEQVLSSLVPNIVTAVRSSATDEKGGNGIYESSFVLFSGDTNKDLACLEDIEKRIYLSYFTKDASMYQRRREIMGMGLLIQPVVGSWYGNCFTPAISGICTFDNGTPIMRTVIGLGTKSVRLDKALILDNPNTDLTTMGLGLESLQRMDTFDKLSGECKMDIIIPDELKLLALKEVPKLHKLFSIWQKYYQQGKPFYWEFAIDPSYDLPCIVQSTPEEPYMSAPIEMGDPQGQVLCEGKDMVNRGVKTGRGIFALGNRYDFDDLAEWDKKHPGGLIFITDMMLARVRGQIPFSCFSNAAALVEQQVENIHSKPAGSHFAEICKRKDILFLSVSAPSEGLSFPDLLGEPTRRVGRDSAFWDIGFKVTNTDKKGRVEILDSPLVKPSIGAPKTIDWQDEKELVGLANIEAFKAMSQYLHNLGVEHSGGVSQSLNELSFLIEEMASCISRGYDISLFVDSLDKKERSFIVECIEAVVGIEEGNNVAQQTRKYITKDTVLGSFLLGLRRMLK